MVLVTSHRVKIHIKENGIQLNLKDTIKTLLIETIESIINMEMTKWMLMENSDRKYNTIY